MTQIHDLSISVRRGVDNRESSCALKNELRSYEKEPMMELRQFLNPLYEKYHRPEYLKSDPLEFPHRFQDPLDQEAVALISALLAYGKVAQIRRSIEDILWRIQNHQVSPSEFVQSLQKPQGKIKAQKVMTGFVHRFNVGADVVLLLEMLARSWKEYGSLGAHFRRYHQTDARDFTDALNELIEDWKNWAGPRGRTSFSYFLTAPQDGSCCKRWCMFLRWMGRKSDSLDLGLWSDFLRSDQLVIPLDTHTGRISQYLGLTTRKTLNWKAALEVTQALKSCDPLDPVKYDFALCRLGILDICKKTYRRDVCEKCNLVPACHFARSSHEYD